MNPDLDPFVLLSILITLIILISKIRHCRQFPYDETAKCDSQTDIKSVKPENTIKTNCNIDDPDLKESGLHDQNGKLGKQLVPKVKITLDGFIEKCFNNSIDTNHDEDLSDHFFHMNLRRNIPHIDVKRFIKRHPPVPIFNSLNIIKGQEKILLSVALSHVCNRPVGLSKRTNYNLLGRGKWKVSIRDLFHVGKITRREWKTFLKIVKQRVCPHTITPMMRMYRENYPCRAFYSYDAHSQNQKKNWQK